MIGVWRLLSLILTQFSAEVDVEYKPRRPKETPVPDHIKRDP